MLMVSCTTNLFSGSYSAFTVAVMVHDRSDHRDHDQAGHDRANLRHWLQCACSGADGSSSNTLSGEPEITSRFCVLTAAEA